MHTFAYMNILVLALISFYFLSYCETYSNNNFDSCIVNNDECIVTKSSTVSTSNNPELSQGTHTLKGSASIRYVLVISCSSSSAFTVKSTLNIQDLDV
jgi:hypothetical protein